MDMDSRQGFERLVNRIERNCKLAFGVRVQPQQVD